MTDRDSASLMDGVFYGGAAYVFSYLFVYLGVLRQGDVKDRMVAAVTDQSTTSAANASELLDFLVPSTWKYAGWLYHYSTGGSIGVSINLLPGSYGLNHELMFPEVGSDIEVVRQTVLSNPMRLPEVVSVVDSLAALTLVSVTPTALFVAGAVLAYRNNEITPIGGAIAGAKVTAGFLALSVVGVYVFTASISGLTLSASGAVSMGAEGGASLELVEGSLSAGGELGGGVGIEPEIDIGPSLGRAVLAGFFYPMLFGSMGGVVGAKAGIVKAPGRLLRPIFN